MFNLWRSTTFILIFFSLDIVVVILFTNIIGLVYSFWNYIREVSILWTNLLSLYQKMKDLYKSCRSCEVTQLCRWKLLHLNLFSGSKLNLKIIFTECQIFGTRQTQLCRVSFMWHTANGVFTVCHGVQNFAHGKHMFSGSARRYNGRSSAPGHSLLISF